MKVTEHLLSDDYYSYLSLEILNFRHVSPIGLNTGLRGQMYLLLY